MANIDNYVEEVNRYFREVAREMGNVEDIPHAMRVTTAVLHTLRDRISVEESMHVISNLPMILKGIYVDGWKITRKASDSSTLKEFLNEVRMHSPVNPGRDFGDDTFAEEQVKAVIRVLRNYIDDGEIRHIRQQLPEGVAMLFD